MLKKIKVIIVNFLFIYCNCFSMENKSKLSQAEEQLAKASSMDNNFYIKIISNDNIDDTIVNNFFSKKELENSCIIKINKNKAPFNNILYTELFETLIFDNFFQEFLNGLADKKKYIVIYDIDMVIKGLDNYFKTKDKNEKDNSKYKTVFVKYECLKNKEKFLQTLSTQFEKVILIYNKNTMEFVDQWFNKILSNEFNNILQED